MALDLEIYLIGGIFGTKAAPADTAAFAVCPNLSAHQTATRQAQSIVPVLSFGTKMFVANSLCRDMIKIPQ
jgi:hypothetical protein